MRFSGKPRKGGSFRYDDAPITRNAAGLRGTDKIPTHPKRLCLILVSASKRPNVLREGSPHRWSERLGPAHAGHAIPSAARLPSHKGRPSALRPGLTTGLPLSRMKGGRPFPGSPPVTRPEPARRSGDLAAALGLGSLSLPASVMNTRSKTTVVKQRALGKIQNPGRIGSNPARRRTACIDCTD